MRALVALVLLVGCTTASPDAVPAAPAKASLSRDALTVVLTDGTRCKQRLDGTGAQSGRMAACGVGMGFAIRPLDRVMLARMPRQYAQPLRQEGANAPLAEVILTDPAGIDHVFLSPAG